MVVGLVLVTDVIIFRAQAAALITKNQLLNLSDEVMKEDKVIIEDLIVAAHNNAKSELKSKTSEEISKSTSGLGIPGFKWPL